MESKESGSAFAGLPAEPDPSHSSISISVDNNADVESRLSNGHAPTPQSDSGVSPPVCGIPKDMPPWFKTFASDLENILAAQKADWVAARKARDATMADQAAALARIQILVANNPRFSRTSGSLRSPLSSVDCAVKQENIVTHKLSVEEKSDSVAELEGAAKADLNLSIHTNKVDVSAPDALCLGHDEASLNKGAQNSSVSMADKSGDADEVTGVQACYEVRSILSHVASPSVPCCDSNAPFDVVKGQAVINDTLCVPSHHSSVLYRHVSDPPSRNPFPYRDIRYFGEDDADIGSSHATSSSLHRHVSDPPCNPFPYRDIRYFGEDDD